MGALRGKLEEPDSRYHKEQFYPFVRVCFNSSQCNEMTNMKLGMVDQNPRVSVVRDLVTSL